MGDPNFAVPHYVSPPVTRNALELLMRAAKPEGKFEARGLSPRRRHVLQLKDEGRNRKETAELLDISVKAVEFTRPR